MKIEVFYTGGGIWLSEVDLEDGTYAVVSSEAPERLSVYNNSDEKYLPEDVIFSEHWNNLELGYEDIYRELKRKFSQ